MPAPIVHVEVRGLDAEELRRFYAEVFDWQREEDRSIGVYSVGSLGSNEVTAATGPVPNGAPTPQPSTSRSMTSMAHSITSSGSEAAG